MSAFMADYEQNMSTLSRDDRIRLRNQVMMMMLSSGTSKQEIQKEFNLSDRQLRRIINEDYEQSKEWYEALPRKLMLQIFRFNSMKVFKEITRLENIRNEIENNKQQEFDMTKDIIDSYTKYTRMVAEGPALVSQKETTRQAKQVINQDVSKD